MRRFAITPGDGRGPVELRSLIGRADAVIVREPGLDRGAVERWVDEALAVGLDVWVHARCAGAFEVAGRRGLGVHLPADHPPVAAPHGRSCHDAVELDRAFAEGCAYALLSPVFPPTSKPDDLRPPLGVARFVELAAGRKVVALGGVDAARAGELAGAGAWGVASIGWFFPPDQKANRSSS